MRIPVSPSLPLLEDEDGTKKKMGAAFLCPFDDVVGGIVEYLVMRLRAPGENNISLKTNENVIRFKGIIEIK